MRRTLPDPGRLQPAPAAADRSERLAGVCGRYAASRSPDDLVEEFELDEVALGPGQQPLPPRFNVAPTDPTYAVLARPPRDRPDAPPQRQLRVVRWGLVPPWADSPAIGSRLINARMETVDSKPAFRRAYAARRAIVPADGYYEWYAEQERRDARGRPVKQPFFIRPKDGGVLAMAGLYELWRDRSRPDGDPHAWLWTATVLTTEAEDALGRIHDRMPLLVEPERYAEWLDPTPRDRTDLRALLVPAAPGRLEAYPVSTEVNSVRNDGPHLVEPLPAAGVRVEGDAEEPTGDTLF
jgi:putative SOS response-associated peptidase YedK